MSDQDELWALQSEGRQRLRDLELERNKQAQAAAESESSKAARRAERKAQRRQQWAAVWVQTVGTVIGGVILALGGLAVGLIRSTPKVQLLSGAGLIISIPLSVLGAVYVTRQSNRANRLGEEVANEFEYMAEVVRITTNYRLGEDPSSSKGGPHSQN